jgi:hypothetical protein
MGGIKIQAYCVKCKTKREMKNPKVIVMKNGRRQLRTSVRLAAPSYSASARVI